MTPYSVQPKDRIFVTGYGLLSSAENMGRNIGKRIIRNLSSKYNQNFIAKKSAIDALKTASKIQKIQKAAEGTGDLISNKVADKRVSKMSPKNNSETNEEILEERYMSPGQRNKITNSSILL